MTLQAMPLNAAQLGVWTAEAVQETNDAFQIAQLMWIDAPLDADCFRQAAETVGREAEILRTRPEDGGDTGPALKANAAPPAIRVIAEPQTDEEISRLVSEHARARSAGADPFGTGFTLYTRTGGGSCWALNTHHLLLDAYGVGLVTRRVAEVYTALTEGREVPAAWFAPAEALAGVGSPEETTHGDADESLLRSWAAVLTAAEDDLPAGGRGQRRFSSDPSAAAAVLGSDLASSVDEVAGLARVSWSDLLTTAWGLYCAQLEGRSSFSVRLFRMNRADRVALTAPGMCVTSVPVVFALDPGMGFRELLGQARARIRSAVTSPVVGEELLARQWPHGTADYYGITQVNIKAFDYDYRFGGSRGRQETITSGPVGRLDLSLYRDPVHGFRLDLGSSDPGMAQDSLARTLESFQGFLSVLLDEEGGRPIGSFTLPERLEGVSGVVGEVLGFGDGVSVDGLVRGGVVRGGCGVALVGDGGVEVSFGDFDARVNGFAGLLVGAGVGVGDRVVVMVPRSVDLVVVLAGVLRAGGVFVPVDVDAPVVRVGQVVADVGARVELPQV